MNRLKILHSFSHFFLVTVLIASPFFVLAQPAPVQNFIPCGTVDLNKDGAIKDVGNNKEECGFSDLMTLVSNIANYLIILGAAVSALSFAWAGFLIMTAGGEMGKIEHAKEIFTKVLIGFVIMLAAWLIVSAINAGLISKSFIDSSTIKPL